jgi:hypothetical protein
MKWSVQESLDFVRRRNCSLSNSIWQIHTKHPSREIDDVCVVLIQIVIFHSIIWAVVQQTDQHIIELIIYVLFIHLSYIPRRDRTFLNSTFNSVYEHNIINQMSHTREHVLLLCQLGIKVIFGWIIHCISYYRVLLLYTHDHHNNRYKLNTFST